LDKENLFSFFMGFCTRHNQEKEKEAELN
jgi:hypothetical protein